MAKENTCPCFVHPLCRVHYGMDSKTGHGWTRHVPVLPMEGADGEIKATAVCRTGNGAGHDGPGTASDAGKNLQQLTVQFFGITRELSEEKKIELDGLLWDVSLRLVEL